MQDFSGESAMREQKKTQFFFCGRHSHINEVGCKKESHSVPLVYSLMFHLGDQISLYVSFQLSLNRVFYVFRRLSSMSE